MKYLLNLHETIISNSIQKEELNVSVHQVK